MTMSEKLIDDDHPKWPNPLDDVLSSPQSRRAWRLEEEGECVEVVNDQY